MKVVAKLLHGGMRLFFKVMGYISPSYAAKWADRLFFKPFGLPRPESEMPYYKSAEQSSIEFNGNKIALYTWGEGEKTIILLHGWASRGTRLGHLAKPLNEKGFRVVTFDMPAHGDSEGKGTNLLEITKLVSVIHKKFDPVHSIIAHSFGGMALSNALHRQDLTMKRAVLIASPFKMEYIVDMYQMIMGLSDKVTQLMVDRIRNRFLKTRNIDIFDLSVDRFASTLNLPFLVIHDREDKDVYYDQGVGYAENLPNVEFISTTGLGHRRVLKDPETVNRIVEFATGF